MKLTIWYKDEDSVDNIFIFIQFIEFSFYKKLIILLSRIEHRCHDMIIRWIYPKNILNSPTYSDYIL
jgi:hypothetical protein